MSSFKEAYRALTGDADQYSPDEIAEIMAFFNGKKRGKRGIVTDLLTFSDATIAGLGSLDKMPSVRRTGRFVCTGPESVGEGILKHLVHSGGVKPTLGSSSLDGDYSIYTTLAQAGKMVGVKLVIPNIFRMRRNLRLKCKFSISAPNIVSDIRLYIGFSTASSFPISGYPTSPLATGDSGVVFGKTLGDGNFKIFSNDATGTELNPDALGGTGTEPATIPVNSNVHVVEFKSDADNTKWMYNVDGGADQDILTRIPALDTQLYFRAVVQNSGTTIVSLNLFYIEAEILAESYLNYIYPSVSSGGTSGGPGTWDANRTETLKNKTENIDENMIKHSTTNLSGDILVNDTTKFIRFPKGTSLQQLRVKSDLTGLEWFTPSASSNANVYTGQANTFGDFDQSFRSGRVKIANPANNYFYSLIASAISSNLNLTLPAISSNDELVAKDIVGQIISHKNLVDTQINDFLRFARLISTPSLPSVGYANVYLKQKDADNDGLFTQVRKNGSVSEVEVGTGGVAGGDVYLNTQQTLTKKIITFSDGTTDRITLSGANLFSQSSGKFSPVSGAASCFDVMPNQAVNSNAPGGVFRVWATNDTTNYDLAEFFYQGTAGWIFGSNKAGTATAKDFLIRSNGASMITLKADNSIDFNSRTSVNQSLAVESNTLKQTTPAAGALLKDNGTKFVPLPRGTANQVLSVNAGGTDIAWTTPATGGADPNAAHVNADNAFGAHYEDLSQIAAPANPAAGIRRIYVDSGTGKLSTRTSAGTTVSLEEQGGNASTTWGGYDYYVFIDTTDANKIKGKNGKTGVIDYTHATNFDSVFQSVLNAVGAAGGGKVVIGPGNFNVTQLIWSSTSNMTITGSGREATILTRTASDAGNNTFTFTGNNITLRSLTLNDNYPTNSSNPFAVVDFSGINILVDDVYVRDWKISGILNRGSATTITNCIFKGANVVMISQFGVRPYTAASRTRISNCVFTDISLNGIFASGITEITNCYFLNNCTNPITGGSISTDDDGISTKIIGCTIGPDVQSAHAGQGIETHTPGGEFFCINNRIYNQTWDGILIHGPVDAAKSPCVVMGNIISNCGQYGVAAGIKVYADSTPGANPNFIITNNICYDDQVTHTQDYGIWIADTGANHYIVRNNLCYGNVTAGILDSGTGGNKSVGDNLTY